MGYDLTDDDIDRLWRRMHDWPDAAKPSIRINRAAVRDWFATLPVVALADVERALGPATDKDVAWFSSPISVKGGLNAFIARRRRILDEPATEAEPAEPPPSEPARPGDVEATEEDAREFRAAINREHNRQADMGEPFDVDLATCAALNAVYRRMRARERPAPSGPDPLAEPTDAETKTAYDRFRAQPGGMGSALRHVLVGFVADRRKSAPPHALEPPPSFERIQVEWLIDACESLWTYADTIHWSPRETNTQEWLDGLREFIAASRAATISAALWLTSSTSPPAPEPTKTETPKPDEFRERAKWAIRGYWRGAGLEYLRDTLEALFGDLFPGQSIRIREDDVEPPSSAPEPAPPPPAVDYMVYHCDRIEFRGRGDGRHAPLVATVTAEAILAAMRAVAEKGVDA